jgi:predicted Zn-dependent protease
LATATDLKKTAGSAELENLIGDIQEARGDNLAAVKSYQAAVALAPNEEKYRLGLALDLIQHKSFEPARLVLKQAEQLHPDSWQIRVALGMVEYFAGSAEDANRTLLKAADVAADPEPALRYLGEVQMDQAGAPDPAAVTRLCEYGDAHSNARRLQFYCAALLFRRDYVSHDRSHAGEILRRLNVAAKTIPNEASTHCQLGKAYRWIERWQEALSESETCASMDANSADAHYRLAQIYQHLGQQQRSDQEMKLYQAASIRLADENARRDETIKTFLYSIQNQSHDHK